MANLSMKEARQLARSIVKEKAGGIRLIDLINEIHQSNPETPVKRIRGSTWDLDAKFPVEITKSDRGIFAPTGGQVEEQIGLSNTEQIGPTGTKFKEADFYEPFAEFLKDELESLNDARPLGGAGLKWKWGTPDVVGTYRSKASDLIKFPPEIVSAELKTESTQPVVAFGQAIAYRLFSTKTYISMPTTLTEQDKSRLEALCMLFGVGLVFFDLNKDAPNFSIRMRAQRFSPDMFYVNQFAEQLKSHNAKLFDHLFG